MKYLALLAVLLLPSVARAEFRHYNEWTESQKAEFAAYTALTYIDFKQTQWAMKQVKLDGTYRFEELNPILGKRPSDTSIALLMLAGIGTYYYLIGYSSDDPLTSVVSRSILMTVRVSVVLHNDSVGVSLSRAW